MIEGPFASRPRVWLDALLPSALLEGNADALRRGRVLIGFSGLMLLAAFFGAPYTLGLGYPELAAGYSVAALVGAAAPLALHRTGRLDIAGNLLVLSVFLPLSVANLQTGGVGGSAIYLLGLMPVIAILVAGLRSGLVWTALCLIQVWAIAAIHQAGIAFSHPLPRELIITEQTVGASALLLLLPGLAATYELLKSRALADVERARAEARAAEQAKAEFLANMSHEIRTPMNAVIGMTGLLLESPLTSQQREDVETIRVSGEVLVAIIDDILDLSKIEAGRLELEVAAVSLRDCVRHCMNLVAGSAAAKGLELVHSIGDGVPDRVTTDVTRLSQILVNLLSNAVKFTPAGRVEVLVDGTSLAGEQVELRIAVRDTGIGIPAERQHRLFRPFSQADASTTRRFGGTGLGLAISARLVELLGGRIWVESSDGQGSTFHVAIVVGRVLQNGLQASGTSVVAAREVPQLRSQPGRKALRDGRTSETLRVPLRILLAEDNVVNQKVALRMLASLGHQAEVVTNGAEVLRALEARQYDVVLMDVHMPEIDGLEATRRIVARWPQVRPRIIAMTASVLDAERDACVAAGMDDFLCKPVSSAALRAALEYAGAIAPPAAATAS